MAFNWLMTYRGIPQMYYGNEILLTGFTSPNDGHVRQDFPGGWKTDKINKFSATGRTFKENSLFNQMRQITRYRKQSTALQTGKLMQYLPVDGLYVYFRYDASATVMCIMNTSEKEKPIDFNNYPEQTSGFKQGREIISGEVYTGKFNIPAMTMQLLELTK